MDDRPLWIVMTRVLNGIEPVGLAMFVDEKDAFYAALQASQRYLDMIRSSVAEPALHQQAESLVQDVGRALQNRMSTAFRDWFWEIYRRIRTFSRSMGRPFEIHVSSRYPTPAQWTERRRMVPAVLRALEDVMAYPGTLRPQDARHDAAAGDTKLESPVYYKIAIRPGVTNIETIQRVVRALAGKKVQIRITESAGHVEIKHEQEEHPAIIVLLEFQNRPPEPFSRCAFEGPPPTWQLPASVHPGHLEKPIIDYLEEAPTRILLYVAGYILKAVSRVWWPLARDWEQPEAEREAQLTYIQNTIQAVDDWLGCRHSGRETTYWENHLAWPVPVPAGSPLGQAPMRPLGCDHMIIPAARQLLTAMRDISTAEELDALGDAEALATNGIVIRSPLRTGKQLLHSAVNLCLSSTLRAFALTLPPITPEEATGQKVPAAESKANQYADQVWAELRGKLMAGEPYLVGTFDPDDTLDLKIWKPEGPA